MERVSARRLSKYGRQDECRRSGFTGLFIGPPHYPHEVASDRDEKLSECTIKAFIVVKRQAICSLIFISHVPVGTYESGPAYQVYAGAGEPRRCKRRLSRSPKSTENGAHGKIGSSSG